MEKGFLINSLHLERFRGQNQVLIDGFSRVNIFVGANNCGKTSMLEALKILSAPNDMGQLVQLALQRIQVSPSAKQRNLVRYLMAMFQKVCDGSGLDSYRFDLGVQAHGISYRHDVTGTLGQVVDATGMPKDVFDMVFSLMEGNLERDRSKVQIINGMEYAFPPAERTLYRAQYVSSTMDHYRNGVKFLSDHIIRAGKEDVLQILKTFDTNVDDISIVGEDVYLHSTLSGSLPLFAYGAGMQKTVFLAAYMAYCKNGVILVDEIDSAIHVSAFEGVFAWFLEACRNWDVQAFVTTHSAEAIDAVIKTVHDRYCNEDLLRIITLRKDPSANTTRAKIRSGEEAYRDRTCFEMELRV